MPLFKSTLEKQIAKRAKVLRRIQQEDPNYFDWENELELDKYSTYIYITPRNIGKTYSAFKMIIGAYQLTGEWSNWMRTTDIELKEILKDYKTNRPPAWPEWAELRGSQLIDTRNGKLIIKFVAVSTLGNLASITGNGCFCIYYDEFLPRNDRRVKGIYDKVTDYIRTVERENMILFLLGANLTTLNSDILVTWDLWDDEKEVDDLDRRMKYRLIQDWENPPKVIDSSTAAAWASNSKRVQAFMDRAEVLDNSKELVIPRSRLGALRHYMNYTLDGYKFTQSIDDNGRYVLVEGHLVNMPAYMLTTEDALTSSGDGVIPHDLQHVVGPLITMLQTDNLVFTSFELKTAFIKFAVSLLGKIRRKVK